ncbi:MAG: hypothetical protein ACP5XB_20070 [Isosphaeraceae bacterium]
MFASLDRERDSDVTPCAEGKRGTLPQLVLRVVHGLLIAALAVFCVLHLDCWIVSYIEWPWSPDHDVFATLARSWDAGVLPYRDLYANNPPPTIYLYWVLGKVFGWGKTVPFLAFDASLVVVLAVVAVIWSERLFASALYGLVGYALFLRQYLPLDYATIGERDWHASLLAVVAIMLLQAFPGRRGRITSAAALALAAATRPQAALFLPAVSLAIAMNPHRIEPPETAKKWSAIARNELEYALAFACIFILMFAPLVFAGVFGDFVRCFRRAAYGGIRAPLTLAIFWDRVSLLLSQAQVSAPLTAILILACCAPPRERRLAWVWLAATVAVVVYKPISPRQHDYLDIPRFLFLSVDLSAIAGIVIRLPSVSPWLRLGVAAAIVGLSSQGAHSTHELPWTYATWAQVRRGEAPVIYPDGYVGAYSRYEYDEVLRYIKTKVSPDVLIANALAYPLAITGPTARLSAFPAESLAWLRGVRPDDEEEFVKKLEETPHSVVVWCPTEFDGELAEFKRIKETIHRLYEQEEQFSSIEIWRRKELSQK